MITFRIFFINIFLLALYNNITYKFDNNSLFKAFLTIYQNKSSYKSTKPDILQKKLFIKNIFINYIKIEKKYIFYQTTVLKIKIKNLFSNYAKKKS